MNVYDFDGTIYKGDSTIDFYLFSLKRHPKLLFYLLKQLYGIVAYKLGAVDKTHFKEMFYIFLRGIDNVDWEVEKFWNQYEKKIKKWYLKSRQESDVIISASPDFLLEHICRKLNVELVCSIVDKKTGLYDGINCYGDEKVRRFRNVFGESAEIENFYSDSLSDEPMADIAQKSFLVKGEYIVPWI